MKRKCIILSGDATRVAVVLLLALWGTLWYMRSPANLVQENVQADAEVNPILVAEILEGTGNKTSSIPDPEFSSGLVANETLSSNRRNMTLRMHVETQVIPTGDEDFPVTVVLPVIQTSLPAMLSTLSIILPNPGRITEIVLLCPADIQATIRQSLRRLLHSSEYLVYVDIDLSFWPPNVDEALASVNLAQQLASTGAFAFLFLDSAGFTELKTETVASLISAPMIPFPFGPRVTDTSGADFVCFSSKWSVLSGFLVPPLLIPSSLLAPQNVIFNSSLGIWASFAEHSTAVSGTGGVVHSLVKAGEYFCSSEHQHQSHINGAVRSSGDNPVTLGRNTSTDKSTGTFIFVFPSVQDLRLTYSLICRLQEDGHQAFSMVASEEHLHIPPSEFQQETFMHIEDCDIDITTLPDADTLDDQASSLWDWIVALPSPPDVVVTTDQKHEVLDALEVMRGRHRDFDSPTIRVPRSDLPFCDWMGSLSLEEWLNWHTPQIDISIITDNRSASLSRLLKSLSSARYFGDSVNVRINMEQTADADTKRVVQEFQWGHGSMSINRRVIHGGLLPAVVESWYPRSNDSYGLILEDDVEVSPLFYAWAKMALLKYRYGRAEDKSPQLFGISLYQQKNLELRPEGSRHRFSPRTTFLSHSFPHPNTPYLSQIPCSWGALYFPEHWGEFHDYLSVRLSAFHDKLTLETIVAPGVRSNKWTRSWKKYFIEMAYLRGYVMLYPNYKDYVSLSTNHLEVGSHVKDVPQEVYAQKRKLFQHPLMQLPFVVRGTSTSTGLLDLPAHEMPAWNALPTLDLLGLVTNEEILVRRGVQRGEELFGCLAMEGGRFDVLSLLCLSESKVMAVAADRDWS